MRNTLINALIAQGITPQSAANFVDEHVSTVAISTGS